MSSEDSINMKAARIVASHSSLTGILRLMDPKKDKIEWEKIDYGVLSGGTQAAISWIYCLFCDETPPKEWGYRDPFESFFSIDRDVQVLILKAMAIRYNFIDLTVVDREESNLVKVLRKMSESN